MEKSSSSGDDNKTKAFQMAGGNLLSGSGSEAPKACSILDPDCEACQ